MNFIDYLEKLKIASTLRRLEWLLKFFQVIRKAIGVAVYTLPDTTTFLNEIAPGIEAAERKEKLAEAGAIMKSLFERTDNLYIKHKLQSIP